MGGTATVVGGGPAGLMAAEVLAGAGFEVRVFDHMASFGRKFLLAGRGGLNITHSRPVDELLERYGPRRALLEPVVRAFGPDDLRDWCAELGEPTFVGSSGRVFPASFRATPLLRAWLRRLSSSGVVLEPRHRWLGWAETPDGTADPRRPLFRRVDGTTVEVVSDVVVLALGGASWPRVGSDGGWVDVLGAAGITVEPLRPANCGVVVGWSPGFAERFAGVPLKNVAVSFAGSAVRGDAMITMRGLEGGPVYDRSASIREALESNGTCTFEIDLHPDLSVDQVVDRLSRRRPKDSVTTWIRRALGLGPAAVGLIREATSNQVPTDFGALAELVKAVPVVAIGVMPIDRAISTAGGISVAEIDHSLMLHRLPGTFVAGEMLDWEAPTGGYLLQAAFSTAVAAARGATTWIESRDRSDGPGVEPGNTDPGVGDATEPGNTDAGVVTRAIFDEIDAGDTLWRFDRGFLASNWTCIWGRGCHGIGAEPAAHLGHGCCSLGAQLDGVDEALDLSAVAAMIPTELFEHSDEAAAGGIFSDESRTATRVVDGACIFLNRPGYRAGAGCALHLAALASGESPNEWKPSVCWQLPIKVDWEMRDDGVEVATVRGWERRDWGAHGSTMAWVCTEGDEAYVGDQPVIDSLADELRAVVGEPVYVELRSRHRAP
jgi:uncharacterized flavoprotein (TIGR03862 family)